jgi:hypothetical protein
MTVGDVWEVFNVLRVEGAVTVGVGNDEFEGAPGIGLPDVPLE